jgi:hypothetical protein
MTMAISDRKHKISISYPNDFSVSDEPIAGNLPRRRRDSNKPLLAEHESELASALASSQVEMQLLDAFTLLPQQDGGPTEGVRQRRGEPAGTANVVIEVPVAADEFAVLLTEQDGVFSWRLPTRVNPAGRRRRGEDESVPDRSQPRQVTFELEQTEPRPEGRVRRSSVVSWLLKPVRVYVIKFAARVAGAVTMKFLERNVDPKPIRLASPDVGQWRKFDPADCPRPGGEKPRILLLVHGTFSSTKGSFGGLATTDAGTAFLQAAGERYDLVMGYDHRTLSETPEENARDLLGALQSIRWIESAIIDVVCYSRGGLVTRYLLERLLPASGSGIRVEDAVFVGCTNAGTHLAEPENWQVLVDGYTNLALLACKAAEMLPTTKVPASVIGEVLQGASSFVKYLVSEAVSEGGVPGLAAMEPDGALVTSLNGSTGGVSPKQSKYHVVQSNFDVSWFRRNRENETLMGRAALALADSLADQLMQRKNDLVVPTESMAAFGRYSVWFDETNRIAFEGERVVHHLAYFASEEVARSLHQWLIPS